MAHTARTNVMREIHIADVTDNMSRRLLAEVYHVSVRTNPSTGSRFVCGTARVGSLAIEFDTYSFNNGRSGFYLGPVHVPSPSGDPATLVSKRTGRVPGSFLYGRIVGADGHYRFQSVIVAPELNFFYHALHRGRAFVHANRSRFILPSGNADLYAAACLLTGDAHTLLYSCVRSEDRPASYEPLCLTVGSPVDFVLVLCCFAASVEPFKKFETLLRVRGAVVEQEHKDRMRVLLPSTGENAKITAECLRTFVTEFRSVQLEHREQLLAAAQREAAFVPDKNAGNLSDMSDSDSGGDDDDDEGSVQSCLSGISMESDDDAVSIDSDALSM
jgi:hypothetical protein